MMNGAYADPNNIYKQLDPGKGGRFSWNRFNILNNRGLDEGTKREFAGWKKG